MTARLDNVKAIILAGGRDFGRDTLASRLPMVLWPLLSKTVLAQLLEHLGRQGIKETVICSNGDSELLRRAVEQIPGMQLTFSNEELPLGTAGSMRDVMAADSNKLFLVFQGAIVSPPDIERLIRDHQEAQADFTVALNPDYCDGALEGQAAGIYVCEPTILEFLPQEGHFDIKEGLIPRLVRAGKQVRGSRLVRCVGSFRDKDEYLSAVGDYLENMNPTEWDLSRRHGQAIWQGLDAKVDATVRLYGPVVVLPGATVEENTVIFGPTVLGRNVFVGRNSVIVNSVLWDDSQVGADCNLHRALLDRHSRVPSGSVIEDRSVLSKKKGIVGSALSKAMMYLDSKIDRGQKALEKQFEKLGKVFPGSLRPEKIGQYAVTSVAAIILLAVFMAVYFKPVITDLWTIWRRNDEYSSGLLVPFLALYLGWSQRHEIIRCRLKPTAWGLLAFLAAQALRYFGLWYGFDSAERLSMVLSIAALILALLGWSFFRKTYPIMIFLLLMLPLPYRFQEVIAIPLQTWATSSAVFCLETVGYDVVRKGNIIVMGSTTVAIAEACNGLRMVTAFFIIGGLVALLVQRTWWEKLIVLMSSLPIALMCNTLRLAITAVAFTILKGEQWEKAFHDWGGIAMMPLALAVIVAELWILTKITPVSQQE